MAGNDVTAFINLISSTLIFMGAIVPIGYAIWSRAETSQDKAKIKRVAFITMSMILVLSAFVSVAVFKDLYVSTSLFFMYWLLWFYHFVSKSSVVSRAEIAMVVIDTMLLAILLSLTAFYWVLS
jgi:predicted DNA-binding helix-hairpin-helix protein